MKKGYNILKKYFSSKNLEWKKVIVVFTVLLSIAIVVLHSAYVNVEEMEKQLQQNLADVARQNAVILHSKMHAQYELLTSLSKELEGVTPETIDGKLAQFEVFMEDFDLKRFAFSFPGGMTYSTDGEVTDLSYREFYQVGMEGKTCITGVLTDALREEHGQVNVMTIPIFDASKQVSGVFGLAYDTEVFNKSLEIESFEGQGYSCVINETGEIMGVMQNNDLEVSHNIFEDVLKADSRNEKAVEDLQKQIKNKTSGGGTLYLSGKNYYYCVPVYLMDGYVTWYILTVLPSQVLSQRVEPIQSNQYSTTAWVGILVVLGALLIIFYIKEQHSKMIRFAYEDPLTKGPNFAKFCMEMETKYKKRGYLVALDIINFNNITVVAGAAASDDMIKETWKIVNNALKRDEIAGRVKDDMFLLFLDAPNEEMLIRRIEWISEHICEKAKDFSVYGIQAGFGVYEMRGTDTIENAYSKAKIAREYAASKSELHYALYNEIDRMKMQKEKQLEGRFPTAMFKKEFEVWYQPKYSADECTVVGSEALVRWRNESGELISPGEFIPLFERNGMIIKLDEYMFREVCIQQKKWLDEGKKVYPVSINISRASLYSADVEQHYSDIMSECGIAPEYIQLEVTESVMEGKTDIRELLKKFRKRGIKILMDDFGTGYSSLATLSAQCFDTLKLDKSLIDHIGDKEGETMLYHVIQMGQDMGLNITAEGVENQSQVKFLQNLKCDDIQGFYFSKPLPKKEYEEVLNMI